MSEESKFDELTKALCVKSEELVSERLSALRSAYGNSTDIEAISDKMSQLQRAFKLHGTITREARLLRAGKENNNGENEIRF